MLFNDARSDALMRTFCIMDDITHPQVWKSPDETPGAEVLIRWRVSLVITDARFNCKRKQIISHYNKPLSYLGQKFIMHLHV